MKLYRLLKVGLLPGIVILLILILSPPLMGNELLSEGEDFEDLELIEYQLKVVRIDEADVTRLGLELLRVDVGLEEAFSFITTGSMLEMAGIAGSAMFQLEAYHTREEIVDIASPSVITLLEEPVSIRLTEEILRLDRVLIENHLRQEQHFEMNIMPVRKDEAGRILTDILVSSGGTSSVETTFWSHLTEPRLLGVVNWNRSSRLAEPLRRGERAEMTTYALYATHDLIDISEERRKNIITMDGLSELLWPELESELGASGHFQILSSPDLETLIVDREAGAAFELRTDGGLKTISFGADKLVALFYEDLRVGLRGVYNRSGEGPEMEVAPIISERVFFDPHLEIAGSYYPVFYSLQRGRLETVHAFDLELALKYQPLSIRIRYSSDLGANELRALLGYSASDVITIVAGAEGSSDGVDQYIAGFRLSF